LEKTSKTIKSNHQPITTMPSKTCPEVPHLHGFLNTSRNGDSTTALGILLKHDFLSHQKLQQQNCFHGFSVGIVSLLFKKKKKRQKNTHKHNTPHPLQCLVLIKVNSTYRKHLSLKTWFYQFSALLL